MGLFKSKEQKLQEKEEKEKLKQEQAIQLLIDKGIKVSKIIDLPVMLDEYEYRYFVVDTENKKWCYITKLFNKSTKTYDETLKIYDFSDFVNYEIIEEKEKNDIITSMPAGYGMRASTTTDLSYVNRYEIFVTTKVKEINESSLTLPLIWTTTNISALLYKKAKKIADDMKLVLEYIKNNK